MTPMSSPTLITISSIRPRAFMSEPTANDCRATADRRCARRPRRRRSCRRSPPRGSAAARRGRRRRMRRGVVFRPASAKNTGISTRIATYSMRSISAASSRSSRGRQAPNRNAPNTACTPQHVRDVRARERADQQRREQRACGPAVGRIAREQPRDAAAQHAEDQHATSTASPPSMCRSELTSSRCALPASTTTSASIIHASTSAIGAPVSASRPIVRLRHRRDP